uniref:Uncharacterized protein n=1 Tax=Meloidogyne enterolobii TaxID=390850 RepID=A0A6V7WAK3_MELEN|nr:unnamed protein product [Meloidogyne enterolobii]
MVTDKSSVTEERDEEYWESRKTEIAAEMMTRLNNMANNQDPLFKYCSDWLIARSRRLFKIGRQRVESEECEPSCSSSYVRIPISAEKESDHRCLYDAMNDWKSKFEEERKQGSQMKECSKENNA